MVTPGVSNLNKGVFSVPKYTTGGGIGGGIGTLGTYNRSNFGGSSNNEN